MQVRRCGFAILTTLVVAGWSIAAEPPGTSRPPTTQPAKEQPQRQDTRLPELRVTPLGEDVCLLAGAGGNLALFVGGDGAVLVDSEYELMADKVAAAVREITKIPIRYVVNTHWHFDHVEGNERLHQAGAVIVAHENVRKRMSVEQTLGHIDRRVPASPPAALPTITYTDRLTLHLGGDEVRLLHVLPAHTDGDTFVYFPAAKVLHVGDVFFNGTYPFIDVRAGGSIDGMIKAADRALKLADDRTKIIPGHGALATKADLQAYRDMLATARDRIQALVKKGQSREEVIAAKPTEDLDSTWGRGPFKPDLWVGLVFDGMQKQSK